MNKGGSIIKIDRKKVSKKERKIRKVSKKESK